MLSLLLVMSGFSCLNSANPLNLLGATAHADANLPRRPPTQKLCPESLTGVCGMHVPPKRLPVVTIPSLKAVPQPVSGCEEITATGHYTLTADLTTSDPTAGCFNIHDTSDVTLDCQGHTVAAAQISKATNVAGLAIVNCNGIPTAAQPFLVIDSSSNVLLKGNSLGTPETGSVWTSMGWVNVTNTVGAVITANRFWMPYLQSYSKNTFFSGNRSSTPLVGGGQIVPGIYMTSYGTDNQVNDNFIDGGTPSLTDLSKQLFTGSFANMIGADDGIVLTDESRDTVYNNQIQNVWDVGIETVGVIQQTKILSNRITNAYNGGFGGWYWNSWVGNDIEENLVVDSLRLFYFFYSGTLRAAGFDELGEMPADGGVEFTDNKFVENSFTQPPAVAPAYQAAATLPIYNYMGSWVAPGTSSGAGTNSFKAVSSEAATNQAHAQGLLSAYRAQPGAMPNPILAHGLSMDSASGTAAHTLSIHPENSATGAPTADQFYLTGNTFSKNDFGKILQAPDFQLYNLSNYNSTYVLDLGGNTCGFSLLPNGIDPGLYPLHCQPSP